METDGQGSTGAASPPKRPAHNRWAPGIPRRRRKTGEPWPMQALGGLLPLIVVVAFLALGMVVALLVYGITGSETSSVVTAGSGLVMAALLTQRVVGRILEFFS
jgi:hypothetical protein